MTVDLLSGRRCCVSGHLTLIYKPIIILILLHSTVYAYVCVCVCVLSASVIYQATTADQSDCCLALRKPLFVHNVYTGRIVACVESDGEARIGSDSCSA